MNLEQMVDARKKAEAAVEGMPEGSLKTKAFEVFLHAEMTNQKAESLIGQVKISAPAEVDSPQPKSTAPTGAQVASLKDQFAALKKPADQKEALALLGRFLEANGQEVFDLASIEEIYRRLKQANTPNLPVISDLKSSVHLMVGRHLAFESEGRGKYRISAKGYDTVNALTALAAQTT